MANTTQMVGCRLTVSEIEQLDALAKQAGIDRSGFIKHVLKARLNPQDQVPESENALPDNAHLDENLSALTSENSRLKNGLAAMSDWAKEAVREAAKWSVRLPKIPQL